ncbi:MAG TPA: S8 family serine peptidase, partial [Nitrososphaera sp.]|nr:S8 family serine peptidase [Nitrososphaera sp.]
MAENLRFDNQTNSLSIIIIIIILILSILLLFGWTTSVSESLNAQAQTVTDTTTTTTTRSLQDNIDDLESNAQDVEKKFRDTKGKKIPNQYIVVLKDDFLASTRSSADKAAAQGAELRHIYSHALHGFAVKIPNEKALVAIMKNPEVDYIQPDVEMEAFAQTLPTGVNRVDGDLSSARSGNGAGTVNVDIAILDTGIQLSHPDLTVYKQVTFVSGTSTGNDDNGHGTSVAGIAAAKDNSAGVVGIAPGARLWAIKVLANNGVGMSSDIIKGIDYVTQHANEIDVVNLSFGGEGSNDALRTAILNSVLAGVTYVAAAGNAGKDASSFVPGSFPEVITVSAITDYDGKCGGLSTISTSFGKDDTFASFSNHGSVIDMAAPGVQIKTTARGSSYTSSFTGTSASAPHVTGAAALYKVENPSASPSEIKNALGSLGSLPSSICDGNGHGYFTGDKDSIAEPLLYLASETVLPEPDCTGNLPMSSATASGSE